MKKVNPSLVQGHLGFFADAVSDGNHSSITEWIKENIINENSSISPVNINFFLKQKKHLLKAAFLHVISIKLDLLLMQLIVRGLIKVM